MCVYAPTCPQKSGKPVDIARISPFARERHPEQPPLISLHFSRDLANCWVRFASLRSPIVLLLSNGLPGRTRLISLTGVSFELFERLMAGDRLDLLGRAPCLRQAAGRCLPQAMGRAPRRQSCSAEGIRYEVAEALQAERLAECRRENHKMLSLRQRQFAQEVPVHGDNELSAARNEAILREEQHMTLTLRAQSASC